MEGCISPTKRDMSVKSDWFKRSLGGFAGQ